MSQSHHFVRASSLTLDAYCDLFTRSFANYFYPISLTLESFATRLRVEQQDLYRSVVLMVDGAPAGQASMGLRGDRAWCGGFGIVPEYRGRGLAAPLFAEFVAQAREAGAKTLHLEALVRNVAALSVYTRAGMRHVRKTRLLEWKAGVAAKTGAPSFAQPADMAQIAACFHRLHPVAPTWSRDLPSVLVRKGLVQAHVEREGQIAAYVLYAAHEGAARITDVGAENADQAAGLLTQLQSHYATITAIDMPADSPITAAFDHAGFREFDRQHELAMAL
jgi:GNAT superfamily N-acetyltransferase